MKKRILTVSSANMDFVMKVARVPEAGQTLLDDGSFRFVPGGKGANAAVAIQRLGGDSVFCTRLGNDRNGDELRRIYAREGVDCRFIVTDPERATGLASIMVEPSGQNRIIVFPGANAAICSDDVESAMLCRPDALFMQLEIAADAIIYAARYAAVLEAAKPFGVRPLLELWGHRALHRLGDALKIAALANDDSAGLLLDFYHLYRGGNSFGSLGLVNLGGMDVFHINDYPPTPPREKLADADRVYPGDGVCPFGEILPKMYAQGFRGALSLELFNKTYWKNPPEKTGAKPLPVQPAGGLGLGDSGGKNAGIEFLLRGAVYGGRAA